MCGLFWGAHKSLAPRARTLLGGFGQATLSFFAVATLLFVFFGECPKFCDLARQRLKIVGGVSEVGKDDFSLYFFWRCVIFLVFFFLLRSRDLFRFFRSLYQEKQRDKEKDTSFSRGPSSGSLAPKADMSELLSQCHSKIAELRVSEREGKGDKGVKGSGKGKGRGGGKGQGGRGGKGQLDHNALIAEFKARIQCKHCGEANHYGDHCFEIQRKQKEDRLKTFLIQSGLSEEAAQKAVEDAKKKWKDEKQKGPKAGPRKKDASGTSAASAGAGAPSTETKPMQEDTESQAKKRKTDLVFSEVEKIVDLLRAAVKDSLTLRLPVVVEEEMCEAVLDTGATDSIVASSLVSDLNRRDYCAVKVGDGHYTYSEGEKSVDVCMGNFNLPHVCIVMETSAFQVCLGMNFFRQNAKTILGLIFTASRLIVKNPETDELSLVSLSEKSCQKEGGTYCHLHNPL